MQGFSDSLTTFKSNWKISMEKMTECVVKRFRVQKSRKSRKDTTGKRLIEV